MKEILQQYASYNCWANQKLLHAVLSIDENLQKQNVSSSFPNLYGTFLHVWDMESIWWQRIRLQDRVMAPSESLNATMKDVAGGLIDQSRQWERWVQNATPASLDHVFAYYNDKKEYLKNPVWKTLLHVFNHGTYHRGQAVTILRKLDVKKIPNTDFIGWSRKK